MAPKKIQPLPARQAINQAAYSLFLAQGYHGTSMRQVASQAGLSPAAIYNYYPSKQCLFVTLLSQNLPHRRLIEALREAQGDDVESLVRDSLRRMSTAKADQYDNMRLMFIELLEFQGRHATTLAQEVLPGFMIFLRRMLAADRRLRPIPPLMIARALLGLFVSYAITVAFCRDIPGMQATPDDMAQMGEILSRGVLEPVAAR